MTFRSLYLKSVTVACTLLAVYACAPSCVTAQTEIGFKVGGNLTNLVGTIDAAMPYGAESDIVFGGYTVFRINDQLCIQPELMLSRKRVSRSYVAPVPGGSSTFNEQAHITDLEIPILVKFPFPTSAGTMPSIYAGPVLSTSLSADYDGSYEVSGDVNLNDGTYNGKTTNRRKLDFGLIVGADVRFHEGSWCVSVDVRYNRMLTRTFEHADISTVEEYDIPFADWDTGEAPDVRLGYFSLTVGVGLAL